MPASAARDDESGRLALVVTVPRSEAELACDRLWSLGVLAVEERAAEGRDGADDPDVADGPGDDVIELWTSLGDDPHHVAAAASAFPSRWRWRLVDVDPASTERWRDRVAPTWIADDLVIVPAWLSDEELGRPGGGVAPTVLWIDPGAAFGLGDHPTTVASLRALRSVQWPDASVLDVGCGSGVLGIAAGKAGAARVRAIDISVAAVDATISNAVRNGVDAAVDVDDSPLHEIEGNYDIVLANILAPALVELAGELREVTAPGGTLIVSGLLADRTDHVLDALRPMVPIDTVTVDRWAAIVLRQQR